MEQALLRQLREVIRDEPVSESRLQFLPRWMLDKAILEEKKNFALNHAFEEWNIRALPRDANLISSHFFFQLKHDGTTDKLKLKCPLVPHGNRYKYKEYSGKTLQLHSSPASAHCFQPRQSFNSISPQSKSKLRTCKMDPSTSMYFFDSHAVGPHLH